MVSIWSRASCLGQLLDEAELPVARVVDHDVQPAEMVMGLLDGGEVRVTVGHVEPDRQHRVAEFLGQVDQGRGVSGVGGDLVARSRAAIAHCRPNPRDVAGDEPHFFSLVPWLFNVVSVAHSRFRELHRYRRGVSRASLDKDPREVASMFDAVARRYDLTNTVLSLGQDRFWRRATRSALRVGPAKKCSIWRRALPCRRWSWRCPVRGAWRRTSGRHAGRRAGRHVPKVAGDATRLPFADGVFDAVTISFGLRNVVDTPLGCARWRG